MKEQAGENLLEIRNLRTQFAADRGLVEPVADVSFNIREGETLALVGESGCGKSVTALSILRLIPTPPGRIAGGEILFQGHDLTRLGVDEMRKIRGNSISMIFQEPMTSLNPVFTVGNQIMEAIMLHQKTGRKEARERAIDMLRQVGIPAPEKRVDAYPHEMSGGMRQRVMIAMALSCNPRLLIADEPTTALDVTIQAQIMDLLQKLKEERKMAVMLITHDLGLVAENAQRVVVMYAGKVVEEGRVDDIFASPIHPYTQGLLSSLPTLNERMAHKTRLRTIPGLVPDLRRLPGGCRFRDRCPKAEEGCASHEPDLLVVEPGHLARCPIAVKQWREGGPAAVTNAFSTAPG
ncbi:MAG: Oligopeptide transport ATP-binding protein OppD [Myxococcota bacterium]|nr:Oligopeptide transport ATP-binding protein OppD [Myxococcota bacterium]